MNILGLIFAVVWTAFPAAAQSHPSPAAGLNPHTAQACLACHAPEQGEARQQGKISIIPSSDRNHEMMASFCQNCHQDQDSPFWILVFPPGREPFEIPSSDLSSSLEPAVQKAKGFEDLNLIQQRIATFASRRPESEPAGGETSPWDLEKTGSNPHQDLDCTQCHQTKPTKGIDTIHSVNLKPGDFDDISLCEGCHPGKNIHPVGLSVPSREGIKTPPAILPLSPKGKHKDKVACITCHDIHPQKWGDALLRGIPDRYLSRKEFCEACHISWSSFQAPHEADERTCPLCHSTDPFASLDVTERFNSNPRCDLCHPNTSSKHISEHNIFTDPVLSSVVDKTQLPGLPDRITCVTCHEPHGISSYSNLMRDPYVALANRSLKINPHGKSAFCQTCHRQIRPDKQVSFREGGGMIALCNRCHLSEESEAMIHPVGIRSSALTWKMDFLNWPLSEGAITCQTCHQHPCQTQISEKNPYFLRDGPYQKRDDFCITCHEKTGFKKLNPHIQLTAEGDIVPRSCLACHTSIPNPELSKEAKSSFPMDLDSLCQQCHDTFDHPAGSSHLEVPSDSIRERMESYQEKYAVVYPLDEEGKITCSTCHNPHQSGVVKGKFELGADDINRQRLPTWKGMLCAPCHGGGGLK